AGDYLTAGTSREWWHRAVCGGSRVFELLGGDSGVLAASSQVFRLLAYGHHHRSHHQLSAGLPHWCEGAESADAAGYSADPRCRSVLHQLLATYARMEVDLAKRAHWIRFLGDFRPHLQLHSVYGAANVCLAPGA